MNIVNALLKAPSISTNVVIAVSLSSMVKGKPFYKYGLLKLFNLSRYFKLGVNFNAQCGCREYDSKLFRYLNHLVQITKVAQKCCFVWG